MTSAAPLAVVIANCEARLAGFVGTFVFARAELPGRGQKIDALGPGDLFVASIVKGANCASLLKR